MECCRRPCSKVPSAFFILWSEGHLNVPFFNLENYGPFLKHSVFWWAVNEVEHFWFIERWFEKTFSSMSFKYYLNPFLNRLPAREWSRDSLVRFSRKDCRPLQGIIHSLSLPGDSSVLGSSESQSICQGGRYKKGPKQVSWLQKWKSTVANKQKGMCWKLW